MPRKVKNETASSAPAAAMAVVTAIVGSTLRTTCTRMTCSFVAPSSSAASTYWALANSRVAALVTRKKVGREQDADRGHGLDQAVAERGGDRHREEDVRQGHQRVGRPG